MIQFNGEFSQTVFNITQTFTAGQLSETYYKKVLTARKLSHPVVTLSAHEPARFERSFPGRYRCPRLCLYSKIADKTKTAARAVFAL